MTGATGTIIDGFYSIGIKVCCILVCESALAHRILQTA